MNCLRKTTCRICRGGSLLPFLHLGEHPPVDNFTDGSNLDRERRYPLTVAFCRDCGLVQLLDVVSEEELFHDTYAYFSSASAPLVEHFRRYAGDIESRFLARRDADRRDRPETAGSGSRDLVVDIGSNDGILLQFFKERHRVLGVEPSGNVAEQARRAGIETLTEFFTVAVAKRIVETHGRARVITANNVFAHIDDIDGIVEGIKTLLADDGVFIFEVHYLLDLVEKHEFDTIYHEHLCYYSLKPLLHLFARFGMEIFDVERVPSHGGSIRVFAGPASGNPVSPNVATLLASEARAGLHDESTFEGFQKDVEAIRARLVGIVRGCRQEGKVVVGYGAPAKGNTLLNYCGFTDRDLKYITDTTPHKIGRLTPGSHIPVVSPDVYETETPDYILLLAWNYKDFILQREASVRSRGAKFIIPIPTVEVL